MQTFATLYETWLHRLQHRPRGGRSPIRRLVGLLLADTALMAAVVIVSALEIGQAIHVSDLALPEGVEVKTDGALAVASVVLPAAEVEAAPVETIVEGEVPAGEAAAAAPAEAGKGKAEE